MQFYKKKSVLKIDVPAAEKPKQPEVSSARKGLFLAISTLFMVVIIYLEMRELPSYLARQTLYALASLTCAIYVINFAIGAKTVRKDLPSGKTTLLLLWLLFPPFILAMVALQYNTEALNPLIISYVSGGFLGGIFGASKSGKKIKKQGTHKNQKNQGTQYQFIDNNVRKS